MASILPTPEENFRMMDESEIHLELPPVLIPDLILADT
jgi:hypothetical protein